MPSRPSPESGALLRASSLEINRRVIGALLIREMLTRYGRNNIGFLWLFVEPALFILIITWVWSAVRNVQFSNIPIVAFAVTGYSSLLLWRNCAARCIGAVNSNKALLYHRQVTIMDLFTARVLLELMAITTALVILSIALYFLGWLELPEDLLKVVAGWLLLSWFAAGLGMTIGSLSERAEVIGRFWHPLSYILMLLSGVAFVVDALPPAAQKAVLWIPMINAVEIMRDGWFGSTFRAHYDLPYLIACNIALMLIGIALVRRIGIDTSDE